MLNRLGSWSGKHRNIVVVFWVVALVVLGSFTTLNGTNFSTEYGLPKVESRDGFDIFERHVEGIGAGAEGTIVFHSAIGVDEPKTKIAIQDFLESIDQEKDVSVTGPFDQNQKPSEAMLTWYSSGVEDASQLKLFINANPTQISQDKKIAFATVTLPKNVSLEEATKLGKQWRDLEPKVDGLQIEYGGTIFEKMKAPESELLGLAFAIGILILAFGSVLAMGLPISAAVAGIGVGASLLGLFSHFITIPRVGTIIGVMIGLGVGIDYALFIVTRFREQLRTGHSVQESIEIAIDTSGRAVLFAGLTVVISLLGMLLIGIGFISGLAISAALMVLITMSGSLTLLPALLSFAGNRVEVTRWRGLISAGFVAVALLGAGLHVQPMLVGLPIAALVLIAGFGFAPLRREVPHRKDKPLEQTVAYRWSRVVQKRPWTLSIISTMILLLLAAPVLGMRLGFSDAGNFPKDNSARKAYDLISSGFGPGSNGPLLLVTEIPKGFDLSTARPGLKVTQAVAQMDGVSSVSPPIPSNQKYPSSSRAIFWRVIPKTSPQDGQTTDVVKELRNTVLPNVTKENGLDVKVTGIVATQVDFSEYLAERMLIFFGAVLTLSFLLLMAVFRSLLVPFKAVIMNLLSIGAAYGIMVAIFQWGWGGSIFGIEPAPIEPFLPMVLFAIVFGLSMDYEVFLLSRVREEWVRTGDSNQSVADGLATTARVITAAAAIMVVVFGSFLLEEDRIVRLLGFGLAVAVLIDATIVRMLLVPATMELLGDKNWWLPKWLDRIIPKLNVEGHQDSHVDTNL